MSSSPYRRIIPREETIGQEIGKHWRIDRPYPSPIFQSEGRDHISFIDRSIYTAHSITDRADYRTRIPIELINRRLHICRLFDSTSRFPSSPIFFLDGSCSVPRGGKGAFLPYNSFAMSNDFYLVSIDIVNEILQ